MISIDWSRTTYVSDELVIPTLARISDMSQINDSWWIVKQENVPLPRYHFQLWHRGKNFLQTYNFLFHPVIQDVEAN